MDTSSIPFHSPFNASCASGHPSTEESRRTASAASFAYGVPFSRRSARSASRTVAANETAFQIPSSRSHNVFPYRSIASSVSRADFTAGLRSRIAGSLNFTASARSQSFFVAENSPRDWASAICAWSWFRRSFVAAGIPGVFFETYVPPVWTNSPGTSANPIGPMLVQLPFLSAWKWRCGPVECPVFPEWAMMSPCSTQSPTFAMICPGFRCRYRAVVPSPWSMTT